MAEIRKVTPRAPISDFRQVTPEAGGLFRSLSLAADVAYERFEPAAKKEMADRATSEWSAYARQQMGDPKGATVTSSMGGDDIDWAAYAVGGAASRPDSFTNLDPNFRRGVAAMVRAADAELGPGALKITSAYRSPELQGQLYDAAVKKYGSPEAARKWVAPPGKSKHNAGMAVDFANASGGLLRDPNSREAKWIKENAARFGLDVPMSWEPWEVRPSGNAVTMSGQNAPETLVRTESGALEPRLYSPLSGPILQAYNAAAGVAYASEVMLKGSADIMGISSEFALNPEGFQQAADGYIKSMVDQAPEDFRADIRADLTREAQRRFLGMVEDKQRDTRQRAANSSAALIDRWSDNYADALASGNAAEAADAEAQLRSLLGARERIPGIAWTPEQSENRIIGAQRKAQETVDRRQRELAIERKGMLQTVIKAAKEGLTSAYDYLLSDDATALMHPELMREALGFDALRKARPSFYSSTPDERAAAITDLESEPVAEDWQIDLLKAVRAVDKEITQAFDRDPVAAAQTYMQKKPPAIPMDDVAGMVPALAARRDYMNRLVESGHTDEAAFLSGEEAEQLTALLGKDTPPEVRSAVASAIVQGFGLDADKVFRQTGGDRVTVVGGMLMARGGNPAVAAEALRGQTLIDEGLVQVPSKATRIASVDAGIAAAFASIPNSEKIEADVMKFATAIYASTARGVDPTSDQATELMKGAINVALGQSKDPRGRVTGGVQTIGGNPVFLPIGVSGEAVEEAVGRAFAVPTAWQASMMVSPFGYEPRVALPEVWGAAGVGTSRGGVPMLGGQPMTARPWSRGDVRLKPMGAHIYTMEIENAGGGIQVPLDASGNAFVFDIRALTGDMP